MAFTLQLLHASDFEGGVPAAGTSPQASDAVNFSAVINRLRTNTSGPFGVSSTVLANTLTLSSGDNYLPGPFFNASSDPSLNGVGGLGTSTAPVLGRGDVGILNALGIQASALGNHEFDLGIRQIRDILRNAGGNPGLNFPYLSANLNFGPEVASPQGNIAASDLATNQFTAEASTIRGKIAESTIITVAGADGVLGNADDQRIGIVGATTPLLPSISSPGLVGVIPTNPTDFVTLAGEIQSTVDVLTAAGINKIILLAHMQQFEIELNELAPRLRNVDVIVAGGSHSVFASPTNPIPLRPEDTAFSAYPTLRTSASGQPVLVVNTGSNYRYVGRLVVDFDDSGVVLPGSLNPNITGAYATDQAGVNALYGGPTDGAAFADPRVVAITTGIRNVISSKDNSLFGETDVFLNGTRTDVRTQETNFGNLTADANLAIAKQFDPTVVISLKNGGGIRDNIGSVSAAPGATDPSQVLKLPPQPTALSPNKPVGGISQLDIENSLRFNNTLSLLTVTATQLKDIMEHGVAATAPGATPGQFPQIGGMSIGYNPNGTARTAVGTGNRIISIAITDDNGNFTDVVVQNGAIVGDPNRTFRMVTLNFLASGGDSYPLTTATNRVDLVQAGAPRTGVATFADDGTEQDAFAEYMAANFPTGRGFNRPDVGQDQSLRVRNLAFPLNGAGGNKTFAITQGEGSRTIFDFGGPTGSRTELDQIRFRGNTAQISLANLRANQVGSDTVLSFVGDTTGTQVTLKNFAANTLNPSLTIFENLSLSLPNFSGVLVESNSANTNPGARTSVVATLNRTGDFTTPLTVNLTSNNPSAIITDLAGNPISSVTIPANQATTTFRIASVNDAVINGSRNVTITASAIGSANDSIQVRVDDDDFMTRISTVSAGSYNTGAAEIPAYDPVSRRLFVVDGNGKDIDVFDLSNPNSPSTLAPITFTGALAGFVPNSVAARNGVVAVALEAPTKTDPGRVAFYNASTGAFLNAVTVGALPDMVTFSPDGTRVLTANEGEPNSYNNAGGTTSVDPEGSISIIDISGGVGAATVTTAGFTSFNGQLAALRAIGVRIFGPNATVAQDLEPEYITFSANGQTAYVTLQENNAIAVVDIATATVNAIRPLGLKNHNTTGNGLDPSDRDNAAGTGPAINIRSNLPVFGMYQPDAIASFTAGGVTYLITANEGDARDWPGFSEEVRVGATSYVLDPTVFPNAATLKQNQNLGRLNVSNATGDSDGDGDFDQIQVFGSRSFSIWNATTGALVYDSGDFLEQLTASYYPSHFNAGHTTNALDDRSDNKGPEPEGVVVGRVAGRTYAFIGLERIGGVVVQDITNPFAPTFVQYLNTRNFSQTPGLNSGGDLGLEGLVFVPAEESPNGRALLITANEVSGTSSIFQINAIEPILLRPTINASLLPNAITANLGVTTGTLVVGASPTFAYNLTDYTNVIGTALADTILGNVGNNNLSGGSGNDTIRGGAGNDIVAGDAGNDSLSGDIGIDFITGGSGNDTLDGTDGADANDVLAGGEGDDVYGLDNLGDTVIENANEGTDTVFAYVNYTLPANVENLTLVGTATIGAGNELNNLIFANGSIASNVAGLGGNDTLIGGDGNDTLSAGDGNDFVRGQLGNDSIIGGAGDDMLIGDVGADTLVGGAGNDTLNGTDGANANDSLVGGTGDDTYSVDNAGDVIVENLNEGTDLVFAYIDYALPANVENLILVGGAVMGSGNDLDNVLLIDSGAGGILAGFAGNDTLIGGVGSDQFVFRTSDSTPFSTATMGVDTVQRFRLAGADQIVLSKSTFTALGSAVGNGFSVAAEFAIATSNLDTSSARIIYNSSTGGLFYDQNGAATGFGTGGQFAIIAGAPTLTAADFRIVA